MIKFSKNNIYPEIKTLPDLLFRFPTQLVCRHSDPLFWRWTWSIWVRLEASTISSAMNHRGLNKTIENMLNIWTRLFAIKTLQTNLSYLFSGSSFLMKTKAALKLKTYFISEDSLSFIWTSVYRCSEWSIKPLECDISSERCEKSSTLPNSGLSSSSSSPKLSPTLSGKSIPSSLSSSSSLLSFWSSLTSGTSSLAFLAGGIPTSSSSSAAMLSAPASSSSEAFVSIKIINLTYPKFNF